MGFPTSGGDVSQSDLTDAVSGVIGGATASSDTLGEVESILTSLSSSITTHSNNTSNPHGVTKSQVGLANVDNTADLAKPVSTVQQTALDLKANLNSPALTGTPTAPTAAVGTSTTQLATTAFVAAAAPITKRVGTDQVNSTTTTELITDLSFTLETGKKYVLEYELDVGAGSSGGFKMNFNGTAVIANMVGLLMAETYAQPPVNLINSRRTGPGGSSPNFTAQTSARVKAHVCFQVTTAGTFGLQFACQNSAATATVFRNSWGRCTEVQ